MMTVKDFLNQYHDAKQMIQSLDTEIEELEAVLTSGAIQYGKDRVQSSVGMDRDRVLADIVDKQIERKSMKARAVKKMVEVSDLILKVRPEELSRLLHLRYIEDKTWGDIATDLGYAERHIYRLNEEALQEADKIWRKDVSECQ